MNAADQRRLTPLLGGLCALGALLLGTLVLGAGRGVRWDAAGQPAALPPADAATRRAAPPLEQFAEVWQHPLFTTDRQPAPETDSGEGNVTLGDLQLTGIIITPDLRMALLHGRSDADEDVRVREGEAVGNSGWTLEKLEPRSAVFSRNGQRTELKLVVAGDTGARAVPMQDAPRGDGKQRIIPANAVHPERAAALRLRGGAQGNQPKPPAKDQGKTSEDRERERRTEALKARIESRRRQMQAQPEKEH